jgi:two-component system heavy metal sensor histidine kinase CusS
VIKLEQQPLSIALKMTLWYALSAFALVVVATGLLYWVLVNSTYREDLRDLADGVNNALILLTLGNMQYKPSHKQRPSWAPPHQPQIYVRVLDGAARTLRRTPGMARLIPSPTKLELAAITTPNGEKRDIVSSSGKPFLSLIVRVPGDPPRFMQVAMDREHDENLLARYRERLWIVLGASLVLCSLGGYLIARRGMGPIKNISRTAAYIRATTLHERIEKEGLPAELSGLAETFNAMLDRLESSFGRISQFSNDVAHELRTPLSNLSGEIEVALSRTRTNEQYRDVLVSCVEECDRISRIVQSLLFLARGEAAQSSLQLEDTRIQNELDRVTEFFEAAASESGIKLYVEVAPNLSARLDPTLFRQVVSNLVSNAIAHTPQGGKITVRAHSNEDRLNVEVVDTGRGIAAEHIPHIFDRFYRVDKARSGSQQNAGLGLAIVRSIVMQHRGSIDVESKVGIGTTFCVRLPGVA